MPGAGQTRRSIAARGRLLVKDTDLALVLSGGENQKTLLGLDLGRDLGRLATLHVEASIYGGSELPPLREETTFVRLVAGALRTSGENAFALEYFYNGEGYSDATAARWLVGVDEAWTAAHDLRLPPDGRAGAAQRYAERGFGTLRLGPRPAAPLPARILDPWGRHVGLDPRHAHGRRARRRRLGAHSRRRLGATWQPDAPSRRRAAPWPAPSEYRLAPVKGALQARLKLLVETRGERRRLGSNQA